jgi:hypothetical protein
MGLIDVRAVTWCDDKWAWLTAVSPTAPGRSWSQACGIGALALSSDTMAPPMLQPRGTRFNG